MADRPTKRLFGRLFERRLIPIVVLLIGLLAVPMPSYARDPGNPAQPASGGGSPVVDPHAGHRAAVAPTGGPSMTGTMAMSEPPGESYVKRELVLPTTGWIATASDQASAYPAGNVLDGLPTTIWHSRYATPAAPLPHTVTIDMRSALSIKGLTYLPRQDTSSNGNVGRYSVSVSSNGTAWGSPVSTGTWGDTKVLKTAVFAAVNARYVRLTTLSEAGNRGPWSAAAEIKVIGGPAVAGALPRAGWTASASDQAAAYPASNVLDGNATTLWHSQYSPAMPLPHTLTIDMKATKRIGGLTYLPRADASNNGNIGRYSISVSVDGSAWATPVANATWVDDKTAKTVAFAQVDARYVRLTATTEAGNRGPWSAAAEIEVHGSAPAAGVGGRWNAPIGFPAVPVSAVLLPNNKVLTFAAVGDMRFDKTGATTIVSILDLATGVVSPPANINTQHQMFCSGLAVLADGRVLINGGSTDGATTIYNPALNSWTTGPRMQIPRAYQSTTLLSDGRVFTLGGSWYDAAGNKDGEVFTPSGSSGTWAKLTGVTATRILTADPAGVYRSDNHAWLFAISGGAVFHAGPSKQMNWITTSGAGTIVGAGNRADSADAMNGNAVMYDIGKILTFGGATAYQDAGTVTNVQATRRAYTLDITAGRGQPVVTTRVADMAYARSFGNGVVLPDGTVLALGGQQHPQAFTDTGAVTSPELWDPATGRFTTMAPEVEPRTYHSVALLLPDGRVFSGGGGLCGSCATNHPNGQIFTPPYLLNPDGSARVRPTITAAPATAWPGTTITVTTGAPVPRFALVRTSAVTHTVNTDQRRIPLAPMSVSGTTYTLPIPADRGVALPGDYLLFALDTQGTPSVARFIRIN
ncbi:discoidin domain-containing protein [Micromonospora sp. CPCC 205711]|uniref:discoidin domain-containing protein n=1 Tax=Micromonospora sp. CPCC 205547 TaxID=3122400 RepID=UPI002FF33585